MIKLFSNTSHVIFKVVFQWGRGQTHSAMFVCPVSVVLYLSKGLDCDIFRWIFAPE